MSDKELLNIHINLTKPTVSAEVGITSITGQYNHPLLNDVDLYIPKYQRLSDNIIEDIKFYVTKGNMGAKQIYPLLVSKFPDQILLKQNLYNAIKKFRLSLNNHHDDAQNMIQQHDLIVNSNTKSRLVAQCLSEDETIESYDWFLECILEATYNKQPSSLFSDADSALMNAIARIQSTQRVEKQLDNEAQWAYHNNFLQSLLTNNLPSVLEPVFSKVFEQIKRYLTPYIQSIQQQQILDALLYCSKLVSKDSINIVLNDEKIDCDIGFLEDQLERPQTTLSYLLNSASLEGDYSKISNSALNLSDSNLYIQPLQQLENTSVSRVPFCTINKNTSITTIQVINDNSIK
ncbi:22094_t:CDS:2, partial [Cetraspora pellucida]